ncbi:MAG TPA: trypsin-like peptidase domain-containing protein [Candidatus Peribacteraceae bacterium]|nr:trypsin-like peptidase domain-containing protein [Candidatus Peribacteraceae bacterium]
MNSTLRTVLLSVLTSVVVSAIILGSGTAILLHAVPTQPTTQQQNTITPAIQTSSQNSVTSVVQKADPAVVSVIITKDLPVMQQYYQNVPFGFNSPFSVQIPQMRQNGTQQQEVGGGTAFFVSPDGLLMTNKHVVSDTSASYTVLLNNGRKLDAKVVARDAANDIALLKVDGSNYPYLKLATSEPVLGQSVVAIGNALGEFRNTVSVGVVSGLQRSITAGDPYAGNTEQLNSIIQTDAAINEGNSGGPLLDMNGNVIGMNSAVATDAQNIGFAIPDTDLSVALTSYEQNGRIVRPYLGVRYVPITAEIVQQDKLPVSQGDLVTHGETAADTAVVSGSPADKAGIKDGDIIEKIDGHDITDAFSLSEYVQSKKPGDTVTLTILRNDKQQTLQVTLAEWKQ